jgi:hypothetical protein
MKNIDTEVTRVARNTATVMTQTTMFAFHSMRLGPNRFNSANTVCCRGQQSANGNRA